MHRIQLLLLFFLVFSGCAPQLSLSPPQENGQQPISGLSVRTHDYGSLLFHEDNWRLTVTGIRGTADVETPDGALYTKDTTLSYWDAASASPAGRSNTMGQFMLTILGVILVIGLAAIILYAAFLATDR
jgi:hypothetical protein